MSKITVLLIDGPGYGELFCLPDYRHTIEYFKKNSERNAPDAVVAYQIHRYLLNGYIYRIGALDIAKIDTKDVAAKIAAAKHEPIKAD